jgi:hypothetical protein
MSAPAVDPALSWVLRVALSLLFVGAAAHKLRDVERFRRAVEGYDLLPPLWAVPVGGALIGLEVGIATGLWFARVAPIAALAAAVLLTAYGGAIALNLARGRRDIDCGCGGPGGLQAISAALVARNAFLAVAALVAALPASARALTWIDGLTIAAAVTALALLYVAADGLLAIASQPLTVWDRDRPGDGAPDGAASTTHHGPAELAHG